MIEIVIGAVLKGLFWFVLMPNFSTRSFDGVGAFSFCHAFSDFNKCLIGASVYCF